MGNIKGPPSPKFQVVQRFQELFSQTKYKEAAELAAESPQGILRTPDTVAKFQVLASLYISEHLLLCEGHFVPKNEGRQSLYPIQFV